MAEAPKEAPKKQKEKKKFEAYKPGRMCPKCGARLGDHQDRLSCGRCNYTEFKSHKK